MYDWLSIFPPGTFPSLPGLPKKVKPARSPEELVEALQRWRCVDYGPDHQCHLCEGCKPSNLCGLCNDIKDAVALIGHLLPKKPAVSRCMHDRIMKECPVCKPQPSGSQD